jgi:hypothetical protein
MLVDAADDIPGWLRAPSLRSQPPGDVDDHLGAGEATGSA